MARIRRATDGDLDAIARLEHDCLGASAWSPTLLRGAVDSMLVLDDLAGYALVRVSGDTADLDRIAVAPAYQGRGLGRRLLDAVIATAAGRGAESLMLEVAHDNAAALRLYSSGGFIRLSTRSSYYGPGTDAVVMRRWLAAGDERASLEI